MNIAKCPRKIVIATDVRFWHHRTGAQRRIHSMIQYLNRYGMDVVTLFIGPMADASNGMSAADERKVIRLSQSVVESVLDDWRPIGLVAQVVWKIKCIANWIKTGIRSPSRQPPKFPVAAGKYLNEMESPLLKERFQQMARRLDPDAVIIEYVSLGYLVPTERTDPRPHYLVDTHDLLSDRYRQFQQYGFEHWIRITRDEEAEALRQFDTIIAIQHDEQAEFQLMTGRTREVIFAGHPGDTDRPATVEETLAAPYSLGYFGSDNPSNTQAVEWFLDHVWPDLLQQRPQTTLLIAGSVCRSLGEAAKINPSIKLMEHVTDLEQLYRLFQIAINPVQFGTGLKIKNQEALAFGKPLVVTGQGATGMIPANGFSPFHIVADASEMANKLFELASSEDLIRRSVQAAERYTNEHLSCDRVYRSLVTRLSGMKNDSANCPADPTTRQL